MTLLIKNAKYIITPINGYQLRILSGKDIVVENGRITCIGENCPHPSSSEVIDASNHIVLPGLIDTHTHLEMSALYGLMPDYEHNMYYERLQRLRDKLSSSDIAKLCRIACMKLVMNGVIGFIDSSRNYKEVIEECSRFKLHVTTGPVNPDPSKIDEYLRETMGKRVNLIINLEGIHRLDRGYLREIVGLAEEHNVGLNIHLSETRREVYLVKKNTGYLPVEYLYRSGFLNDKTIISHANWITSSEIEYLSEKNSMVTVTPHTTMRLVEEGFTPVYEIMSRGIRLAVGTNGASGDKHSVLEEMRELILLYRQNYWDTRLKTVWTLPRLLRDMYLVAGIDGGVIDVGEPAHLAVLRINSVRHRPLSIGNIVSTLLLIGGFDVEATIIDGELVYWSQRDLGFTRELDILLKWVEEEIYGLIDPYDGVIK